MYCDTYRNGKNVGNIIVKERIVDVQFEVLGEFIAVILEEKGAIWYQTSTLQLAFRCSLPSRLVLCICLVYTSYGVKVH